MEKLYLTFGKKNGKTCFYSINHQMVGFKNQIYLYPVTDVG
jgi:hypothetical protein